MALKQAFSLLLLFSDLLSRNFQIWNFLNFLGVCFKCVSIHLKNHLGPHVDTVLKESI